MLKSSRVELSGRRNGVHNIFSNTFLPPTGKMKRIVFGVVNYVEVTMFEMRMPICWINADTHMIKETHCTDAKLFLTLGDIIFAKKGFCC